MQPRSNVQESLFLNPALADEQDFVESFLVHRVPEVACSGRVESLVKKIPELLCKVAKLLWLARTMP